ncbi:MAG: hypothetical protein R3Y07_00125 [Eubacteriales bacterium]
MNNIKYDKAKKLEQEIIELCKDKEAICFFGSGADCLNMLQWFGKKKLSLPVGICDNATDKQGEKLNGIPIMSFDYAIEHYPSLGIIITSRLYGNQIEAQVFEEKESNSVINIQRFFKKGSTLFAEAPEEIQARIKSYTAYLRGENEASFSLLKPSDMPAEAIAVTTKLKHYQELYENGQNPMIYLDNYYVMGREIDFWEEELPDEKEMPLIEFLDQKCYNNIYKIGENTKWLCEHEFVEWDFNRVETTAENISQFNHYLSEREIPFLFVLLPNKLSSVNLSLYTDQKEGLNEGATIIVEKLEEKGVSVYDYRKTMAEEKINSLEVFFRTDHHWRTSTAFHATQKVCEKIEDMLGVTLDHSKFEISNYDVITYPDIFLGSYGKQTGLLYAGLDDFELILPKYKTDYSWICEGENFSIRGSAEKSLLFPVHFDWCYYDLHPYGVYSLIVKGHCKIVNHKIKETRKMVCLCDSFTRPVASFLAPHFSEIHFIDIRGNLNKDDVFNLIAEIKPSVVTMMHWVQAIVKEPLVSEINPYTQ